LIAAELGYGEASPFVTLPAGDYAFTVVAGGAATTFTLEPGSAQTIVAYGTGEQPMLALVPDDLSTVPERSSRLTLYNAYPEAPSISIVDFGSEFVEDDTEVLVAEIAPGERSESIIVPEGTVDWAVVDAANNENVLYDMPDFELVRGNSDLIVFAGERSFDGSLRPLAIPVVTQAEPTFGGPNAVGYALFTTYLLPFQLLGVLLLAAMVGVIVLTHREADKARRRVTGRRRVSRPLANVIAAQVGTDVTESNASPAQLPDAETVGK
jgi:hypothetical protein